MVNLINRTRKFLSFKASILYCAVAAAIMFFNYIAYDARTTLPTVWSGPCSMAVSSKHDTPVAVCMVNDREVTSRISVELLYNVMKDNKTTVNCSTDAKDGMTCSAKD